MNYDLFEALCRAKNTTPTAITNKLGLSKGNSSSWKKGGNPSAEVLLKLADELNCTTDELLGRKKESTKILSNSNEEQLLEYYNELDDLDKRSVLGKAEGLAEAARRKKAELEAAAKEKSKPKPKAAPLPEPELPKETEAEYDNEEEDEDEYIYLDFPDLPVSAGTGIYLYDDYAEQIRVVADEETVRANYALRVAGDSMEPRFYDGDIVLVETQPSVEIGEVGIFIYDGEAYIKKFGGDRLISLNPKYKDIMITDPNSFYCKGRVFSVLDPVKNKYN